VRSAGVILAAGLSSRFGSDKLLATLAGRTVLGHVIDAARQARLSPIVIVVGPGRELTEPDISVIVNPDPARGLSTSIKAGLAELARDESLERALVLLGDQPLVSPAVISRLLEERLRPEKQIVVPVYSGAQPGNPVLVYRPAWMLAATLHGDRGFSSLYAARADLVQYVEVAGINPDVDTPADLAALGPA
jgi:molybdenum cofactor cytidylyltransferase